MKVMQRISIQREPLKQHFPRLASFTLAVFCLAAHAAEWTVLPSPASSGVAVYTDAATEQYRHNGFVGAFVLNPRRAWFVTDYETSHRWLVHDILSAKHYVEFDCKRARMRVLTRVYFAGHMGQGRILATETPGYGFEPVVPGEPEEVMYLSACPGRRDPGEASANNTQRGNEPVAGP